MEFVRQIIRAPALFLVENRFADFYVHPLHWHRTARPRRPGSMERDPGADETLPATGVQQQSETRLLILPILGAGSRHGRR